jgi:hypothetical protein
MRNRLSSGRIVDWAAILMVLTSPITLPAAIEPWRNLLLLVLAAILIWGAYRITLSIRHVRQLRNPKAQKPFVLLIGGTEWGEAMKRMKNNPLLLMEPYIFFLESILSSDKAIEANYQLTLNDAHAIILMPDFIPEKHETAYQLVRTWCKGKSTPIARYYPEQYKDEFKQDFPLLPFNTETKVVQYSAEFLLSRAADRGRFLEGKIKLLERIILVACIMASTAVMGCLVIWTETSFYKRAWYTPPTIQSDLSAALSNYRKAFANLPYNESHLNELKNLVTQLLQVHSSEISRNTSDTSIRLYVYAAQAKDLGLKSSNSQKKDNAINESNSFRDLQLIPVVKSGSNGYPLDITSIAGCAFQHRVAVYWQGEREETKLIKAWRLDGSTAGLFDIKKNELVFEDRETCNYQNKRREDPKKQLLCVPIAVDSSKSNVAMPGVLCASSDDDGSALSSNWIRMYLQWEAFHLGWFDPKSLLPLDSSKSKE